MGLSPTPFNKQYQKIPEQIIFTSFTAMAVTNATCSITQTYVEADVSCHGLGCEVKRIRISTLPHDPTWLLPMDLPIALRRCVSGMARFLQGLVKSTMVMLIYSDISSGTDPYSPPLECRVQERKRDTRVVYMIDTIDEHCWKTQRAEKGSDPSRTLAKRSTSVRERRLV